MISHLLTQSATVKHWTYTEDSLGNKERNSSISTIYGARLEQTDGREIQSGQSTEVSSWRVFLPPGAVVDAEDQIIIDGRTFEVIGLPVVERLPHTPHHVLAQLRYVV